MLENKINELLGAKGALRKEVKQYIKGWIVLMELNWLYTIQALLITIIII